MHCLSFFKQITIMHDNCLYKKILIRVSGLSEIVSEFYLFVSMSVYTSVLRRQTCLATIRSLRIVTNRPRSMAWHCNGTTNQEMVTKLKGKRPLHSSQSVNCRGWLNCTDNSVECFFSLSLETVVYLNGN